MHMCAYAFVCLNMHVCVYVCVRACVFLVAPHFVHGDPCSTKATFTVYASFPFRFNEINAPKLEVSELSLVLFCSFSAFPINTAAKRPVL